MILASYNYGDFPPGWWTTYESLAKTPGGLADFQQQQPPVDAAQVVLHPPSSEADPDHHRDQGGHRGCVVVDDGFEILDLGILVSWVLDISVMPYWKLWIIGYAHQLVAGDFVNYEGESLQRVAVTISSWRRSSQ